MDFEKPIPTPTPTSRPFWAGLNEGKVCIQQCDDCGHWVFYPRTHCSACLSDALTWKEVSGNGNLYTFTITRQPTSPHFMGDVPQLLAVVELDEGVRVTSTLVNVAEDDIKVGMRVKPNFDQVSDKMTLLRYEPA
ncbi:MAG: Zn-ribbon domain-containing OB-fold protein [Pseudomonadota bacterium]